MKKIYIGNLDYSVEDNDLNMAFADHGTVVSANVIRDKFNGRSRGFGFVEMSTAEEAHAAVEKTNKVELKGRMMFVSMAQEKEKTDRKPPRKFGNNRNFH